MASRKELLSAARCSAAAAEAAASAEAAVGAKGSGADAFLEAMWAMDGALGDQSPRLDKKRERAALDRARAGYREQLAVETAPAAVLHLCVLLLEARYHFHYDYCYGTTISVGGAALRAAPRGALSWLLLRLHYYSLDYDCFHVKTILDRQSTHC